MARIKVTFNCGCQFTETMEAEITAENEIEVLKNLMRSFRAARSHASSEHHSLVFQGEIREPPVVADISKLVRPKR